MIFCLLRIDALDVVDPLLRAVWIAPLGINPGAADLLACYEPPSGQHRLGTAQGGGRTQLGIPALQSNCPCILAIPEVFA